LNLLEYLF